MIKFLLLFLFIFFLISSVSSYTIICSENEGTQGVQMWNYNLPFNETGWDIKDIEEEENIDCVVIEGNLKDLGECNNYFQPVVNQLNQNLIDSHAEKKILERKMKRYSAYKYFAIIFVILAVILSIMLKINLKEDKNGERTGETKTKTKNR